MSDEVRYRSRRGYCICAAPIHTVRLPEDLARLYGAPILWVHTANRDIYCYDDDPDAQGAVATPDGETARA